MMQKINDKTVAKEELRSASGNPNKIFKILYGSERRDLFKKYAQEQHRFPVEEDEFGKTDYNDINTWIKPIPGFGANEYYNEDVFDEIIDKLKKEDESRAESRNLAASQGKTEEEKEAERAAEKARQLQTIEENTEKNVKLKEGPGIEYLGIGGKYRIYAVTSKEGAQQFAVPEGIGVRGWCITGGKGYGWCWGEHSYFSSEADRTINKTFYVFEASNVADNWCVYILKAGSYGAIDSSKPSLGFTDNKKDNNNYGIPECDVPYDKVPILAKYAENTIRLNENEKVANTESDGFFRFRGNKLLGIEDHNATDVNVPVAFVEIGSSAFSELHDLERVTFGSTLTKIDRNAFVGCNKLREVGLNSTSLTLEDSVFAYCGSLEKIYLNSVDKIPSRTFAHCKNLKSVELSNALNYIGKEAFLNCSDLTILNIPTSCTTIDSNAFFNCKNLTLNTQFEEIPTGWYKNIANHVKEIKLLEKQETPEEPTTDSTDDIKIEDVTPKKGESKEDFISRFMSETEKEYPDQKQRYAVALSYWEKKKVNDSEIHTLWELFKSDDCAGWIMKMSDDPQKCLFANSNYLGFLEEDEDSMNDKMVVEEKLPIANGLLIYIGHYPTDDVYNTERMRNEKLATVEEAIEEIKKSWPQVQDTKINDDYYHGGIPKNAEEISISLYSTGEYQKNIEPKDKTIYLVLPKKQAYFKTNQEDYYKSPLSKSHIMFYSYPQDTLEEVEEIAQDIISKCNAKLVSEDVYLALKDEDSEEKVHEIFENFNNRKMNDSEMVVNTCAKEIKDEPITPEEQEVKEIVTNFSVQELVKEALDDLKTATNREELDKKYNNWLSKSDEMLEKNQITINQQEEFEDELWEHYKELA